jgi:hypothetical protein
VSLPKDDLLAYTIRDLRQAATELSALLNDASTIARVQLIRDELEPVINRLIEVEYASVRLIEACAAADKAVRS